jgi:hypothetical protein
MRESDLRSATTDIRDAVQAAFFWTVEDVEDGSSFVVTTGDRGIFRVSVTAGRNSPFELPDPPADLADAWERYQHGGGVEPWELRKLDEWRGDVAEEMGL